MSLLLAFFAFSVLPVNYAGLLLILFGLLLLVLEIKVTSYGLLTAGGVVSLIFGSMILMDSSLPELQLSLRVVLPVVLGFAAIAVLLVRLAVAAQRQPPVTGAAGHGRRDRRGADRHCARTRRAGRHARRNLERDVAASRSPRARASGSPSVDGLTLVVRKD